MIKKTRPKIEIDEKENFCLVSINPQIYPLDVIYTSSYTFIDKAYIIIDGNPKKEVSVRLKPKADYNLEKLGNEFYNELLNYTVYKTKSEKNKKIRETIVQRALMTNIPQAEDNIKENSTEEINDPEGISILWEEKYEKNNKKKRGKSNTKK